MKPFTLFFSFPFFYIYTFSCFLSSCFLSYSTPLSPPFFLFRHFSQHLHLKPGRHSDREIQCYLQPAQVALLADPLPCLQGHRSNLGCLSDHHDSLPGVQWAGAVPQNQRIYGTHVPTELAERARGADMVSSTVILTHFFSKWINLTLLQEHCNVKATYKEHLKETPLSLRLDLIQCF